MIIPIFFVIDNSYINLYILIIRFYSFFFKEKICYLILNVNYFFFILKRKKKFYLILNVNLPYSGRPNIPLH